jgi:hypothetical protein
MADAAEKRTNSRRMKELAAEDEARREGLVSSVLWILLEEIEEILRFNSHRSRIRGCGFPHLLFQWQEYRSITILCYRYVLQPTEMTSLPYLHCPMTLQGNASSAERWTLLL